MLNDWIKLEKSNEIESLMNSFGYFHDSCIRSVRITSKEFIDKDLSLHFKDNNDVVADIFIQRQFANPSSVELKFVDVIRFNFHPQPKGYSGEIYEACLKIHENTFIWIDCDSFDINNIPIDQTWIISKEVYFRFSDDKLGDITNW